MAQRDFLESARRSWLASAGKVMAVLLAGSIVGLALLPGIPTDVGYLVLPWGHLVGGMLMLRHGRRSGAPDARAFATIGVAAILAGVGVITFVIASFFVSIPNYGPLDGFFLVAYVLFVLGMALMPAVSLGWRSQLRIVLDGLIGAVALAVLLWSALLEPVYAQLGDLPLDQRIIGSVYPMLDAAMVIGMMVVFLRRGTFRFDRRLLALTVAFALQALADIEYLTEAVAGSFNEADPILLPFLGASLGVLATGLMVHRIPEHIETADRAVPIWALVMPYGAGLVLVVYDAYAVATGNGTTVLDIATGVVLVLVIGRQWLAIHENRTKVEAERRSLIASVSHELRTPLTSMIGFLTVLREAGHELPEEERDELSEVVLEQANYMGRMVTDIILLARDTPEKMTLVESVYPIQELVSSILDTLGPKADAIEVRMDPGLELRIDLDRVRQLAANLLTNAIRYGADRTELRLEANGRDLLVEVHDDGPGVAKKYQQVIWERFERGSNQLNSTAPGTGLGLAIVEMIAKAHGGSASYRDSEVLGGACFSVTLPQRVAAAPESVAQPLKLASQPASVRSL
jgi:signal transduction histidine kinase